MNDVEDVCLLKSVVEQGRNPHSIMVHGFMDDQFHGDLKARTESKSNQTPYQNFNFNIRTFIN